MSAQLPRADSAEPPSAFSVVSLPRFRSGRFLKRVGRPSGAPPTRCLIDDQRPVDDH
jgi:hypothetical protein